MDNEIQEILEFITGYEYPYPEKPTPGNHIIINRFPAIEREENKIKAVLKLCITKYDLGQDDDVEYAYSIGEGDTLLEALRNLKENLIEHTKSLKVAGRFYKGAANVPMSEV
jgi:hypothetical protein